MARAHNPSTNSTSRKVDAGLSLTGLLRYRLSALHLRLTSLWPQIQQFSRRAETTAEDAARHGQESLILDVPSTSPAQTLKPDTGGTACELNGWPGLARFLNSLGIKKLQLDSRLESNQLADILVLLFTYRRALRSPASSSGRTLLALLRSGRPISFACTTTQINDHTLRITYSYCATRFSRMVGWFELRQKDFADHRALFRAAPRYGLLLSLLVLALFAIYTLSEGFWFHLGVALLGALGLFALTYLLFMTIGSVEYDNEEKAYRLEKTYARLKLYADRIANDLSRARTVQQKLIPKPTQMPLAQSLEWAASFIPESEVGGDYFNVAQIAPGRLAILFTDVSGHGMSAALITVIIKTAFQAWVEQPADLLDFIQTLNSRLCRLTPDDSFAVAFLATYDQPRGEFRYVNCGHHPLPVLIPADLDSPLKALAESRVLILGVQEQIDLEQATTFLQPGDTVLFATDGIIESRNPDRQMYSQDRLDKFLAASRGKSAKQLVLDLVEQIRNFTGDAEQSDDQTILAMRVRPPKT